ncbi:hypothetical protein [Pelosinus fermentans]|uniref:Uncharacterized protein n=1 Tax=Pelosinus fermentans JBW45 TaxID=1192197 RepID=I9NM93_9FIRM|nr:hypothetical protein [Pelosinus fermentans]AJQ26923.1 hypothetical protein JBW_01573 [Pelosinus fermentans JBW45]
MNEEEEEKKQNELNNYLRDLSADSYNDEKLIDKSRILLSIYDGKFRHSYSQILGVIFDIKKQAENSHNQSSVSLDYLSDNIQSFKNIVIKHDDFNKKATPLSKLYDHVMLEISRLNYIGILSGKQSDLETGIRDSQTKLERGTQKLDDESKKLETAKASLDKTIEETENLKTEVVTIIGIFAAIMLAFVGGMNFTSATLTSMHQSSIYKVAFISVICGFTFFNTILCLMYIVSRMTKRNIYSQCNNGDCIDGQCEEACGLGTKIKKRLPYVYWINSILLWGLVIVVLAWFIEVKTIAGWVRSLVWRTFN